MKKASLLTLMIAAAWLSAVTSAVAKSEYAYEHGPTVYNFGHVGVDYTVYLNYKLRNTGSQPIRVLSAVSSCDCSHVRIVDSLIASGKTGYIRLAYNTRNFFGPTSQSFTITTNDPQKPSLKVYYESLVGQWVAGVQPDPLALIFLPGQKAKSVTIRNTHFAEMTAEYLDQADTTFSVKIGQSKAAKDGSIVIQVDPVGSLSAGSYDSSFRVQIRVPDFKEPIVLSIPVKVVVY